MAVYSISIVDTVPSPPGKDANGNKNVKEFWLVGHPTVPAGKYGLDSDGTMFLLHSGYPPVQPAPEPPPPPPPPPPVIDLTQDITQAFLSRYNASKFGATVDISDLGPGYIKGPIYLDAAHANTIIAKRGPNGEWLQSIRGSDVWGDSVWTKLSNNTWKSNKTVPFFPNPGQKGADGKERVATSDTALRTGAVLIDGIELPQVAQGTIPGTGQWALDGQRYVILGSDPNGKRVEVVTQQSLVIIRTSNINLIGLEIAHGMPGYQHGLVYNYGASALLLDGCHLALSGNALVASYGGKGDVFRNCFFEYGGNTSLEGGAFWGSTPIGPVTVQKCVFKNGNYRDFNLSWHAAGGMKFTYRTDMLIEDNICDASCRGHFLWADTKDTNATVLRNKIANSRGIGVFYEVSAGPAEIHQNEFRGVQTGVLSYTSCHVHCTGNDFIGCGKDTDSSYDSSRSDEPGCGGVDVVLSPNNHIEVAQMARLQRPFIPELRVGYTSVVGPR